LIDFTPWDHMLRTYVKNGQVDYAQWQMKSKQTLTQWLSSLQATDISQLERSAAIAFLINLYNALTIEQIIQKDPIESVRPKILGVPNMASFLLFFSKNVYTLNGQQVSLNNIEHDILRDRYQEPRIHFALVCASESCPQLRSSAYRPDQLEQQLTEDVHQFINNPAKMRYDEKNRTLYCSKIFKWYESDFVAQAGSVLDYIQPYLSQQKIAADTKIEYLPYDWSLNQRTSS